LPGDKGTTHRTLNQLLAKSERLRQQSEKLMQQAADLRLEVERVLKQDGRPAEERRKKPRLKGK
jgi:hypothetical protein